MRFRRAVATIFLPLALGVPGTSGAALAQDGTDPDGQAVAEIDRLATEGSREALARLVRTLDDPRAAVRDAAWARLGEAASPEAALALAEDGLTSPSVRVRAGAAEALGRSPMGGPAVGALLAALDRDRENRLAVAWALGRTGDARAFDPLARLLADRDWRVRGEAIEALVAIDAARAAPLVAAAVDDDPTWQVRSRALALLAAADPAGAFERARDIVHGAAADGLRDARPFQILLASLDVLRGLGPGIARPEEIRLAVRDLIDLLDWKTGRMAQEIGRTLTALTGQRLQPDPESWSVWWDIAGPAFRPDEVLRPAPDLPPIDQMRRIRYHGVPVVSDHVAFVVECSASLDEDITYDSEETLVVFVNGRPPPRGRPPLEHPHIHTRSRNRLSRAELSWTVRWLPESTQFNIIFFATEPVPWEGRLVFATLQNVERALSTIGLAEIPDEPPLARSNPYGALQLALADPAVDTIYLLVNGAPSAGDVVGAERLRFEIRKINRYRRTAIYPLLLGGRERDPREYGLWENLARENEGEFFPKY